MGWLLGRTRPGAESMRLGLCQPKSTVLFILWLGQHVTGSGLCRMPAVTGAHCCCYSHHDAVYCCPLRYTPWYGWCFCCTQLAVRIMVPTFMACSLCGTLVCEPTCCCDVASSGIHSGAGCDKELFARVGCGIPLLPAAASGAAFEV
jgi:hypothetical protein